MGADGTTYEGFANSAKAPSGRDPYEVGREAGRKTKQAVREAQEFFDVEFVGPLQDMGKEAQARARLARRNARTTHKKVVAGLKAGAEKTQSAIRPLFTGEKTQEFVETFTPASLPLILRGINKRFIEVHDLYHGKPEYFLKLERALDDMYYAYADIGEAPSLGATGSKMLVQTAVFLESVDMDDEDKAKQYREASKKALEEIGKRIQDEMRQDLTGYLIGRVHTLNTGETIRTEPDYRMLENTLVFLEHWNERQTEVTDRKTDPLLSEPRIQELFNDTMQHIRDEIILIHSMLEEESKHTEWDIFLPPPVDEHEERLRLASLREKWGRIFELQRIADELTHLSPDTHTRHPNKIPISEDGLYRQVLLSIAASFSSDKHFGSRLSNTFERNFERNSDDEVLVTTALQKILENGSFHALEQLPVADLVSYCNDMAKSGMLDVVTRGEYRDARGRKQAYSFGDSLRARIRAFLKTHGAVATDSLTKKFSPEAKRILGIDRMLFEIRDEIPLDASTRNGFIDYAKTLLERIPKGSPERAKFLEQHQSTIRNIFLGLWETSGVTDLIEFGDSLIKHGIVEQEVLPVLVFGRKGFFPQFEKNFSARVIAIASLDLKGAIKEVSVVREKGFEEFVSPSLVRKLRSTLRTKVVNALYERGSADTLSFLDELKPFLIEPNGIITKELYEALREDVLYDDPAWVERRFS